MQVYKTFFKIAKKYLSSCLIYAFVFIAVLIAMSRIGSESANDRFKADKVSFAVIDNDNTAASQALLDYLKDKHRLVELDDYSNEKLQDYMYYEKIQYLLIIPEGYEEKLVNNEVKDLLSHSMRTDSAKGYFFNQDVDAYLDCLRIYLTGGCSLDEALSAAKDSLATVSENTVNSVSFDAKKENIPTGMAYYFQYLSYMLMSGIVIAVSPILISLHRNSLQERLACSATTPKKQGLAIGLGCITYCLAVWLIFMIIAVFMYKPANMFSESGFMLMLNSLVYTLCVALITLIIGSFSLESNALNLISNILGLGASFLCGVFVPMWYLSDKVLMFSQFLPTYWYMKNLNMISGASGQVFSKASYFNYLGIEVLFILALTAVFLLVNTQRRKKTI